MEKWLKLTTLFKGDKILKKAPVFNCKFIWKVSLNIKQQAILPYGQSMTHPLSARSFPTSNLIRMTKSIFKFWTKTKERSLISLHL